MASEDRDRMVRGVASYQEAERYLSKLEAERDALRVLAGELAVMLVHVAAPPNKLMEGPCWCGERLPHRKACEEGRDLLARVAALSVTEAKP